MSEEMENQQQIEDEAFIAEMADGEPPAPAEDAEPEAAEVEHQQEERHEVIAGYTEEEIKAALEKAKDTDALRADLAQVRKALEKTNGTYGSKLEQLQQSIASMSQGSEFSVEDFEELARVLDMPEMTEAIVKGLNKRKTTTADSKTNPEAIDQIVAERVRQVEERIVKSEQNAEIKALTRIHPDWKDVAQSQDFTQWTQSALSPQQVHELSNSWDADLVSSRLTEFKAHRDKQQKAAQAVQGRAAAAVVHRGIGGAKQHKSATDEEEEAFRREMASGF